MSDPTKFNNPDQNPQPGVDANNTSPDPLNIPQAPPQVSQTQMPPDSETSMFSPQSIAPPPATPPGAFAQTPNTPEQIPQTPVVPPAANEFVVPSSVTTEPKKFSKFTLFVIAGVIAIIAIYAAVFYLYTKNQKTKTENNQIQPAIDNTAVPEETGQTPEVPLVSPPQTGVLPEYVKIINGNVIYEDPNTEAKVLVDKELFSSTGITGFTRVVVSPDTSKICFESWPPAPEPALFMANSDGSNVIEISPNRRNCTFLPDSKRILYEGFAPEGTDIFIFDTEAATETNLTEEASGSGPKLNFTLTGLAEDGVTATCTYNEASGTEGVCEINTQTNEVFLN